MKRISEKLVLTDLNGNKRMREAAGDPEVQAFYANPKNTFDDVQDLY